MKTSFARTARTARITRASLAVVCLPLALFSAAVTTTTAARAVVLSSLASTALPPEDVRNLGSSLVGVSPSDGTTARYIAADNQRSITQTFVWNSDLAMAGLGLLVSGNQNTVSGQMFTASQEFALDIQEIDNATYPRKVVTGGTITVSFTLTTALVNAGQFLYIRFDTPLALEKNKSYGFNLRPTGLVPSNALAIEKSMAAYADGVSSQSSSVSIIATDAAYGNNTNLAYAFFTTTAPAPVPEPATTAALFGGLTILACCIFRRRG
ncbi:MAG: PEP-CTERM sorting domain-containing protein [Opitutaceae bacterium]|jgi:hypothetical protein|nr:PEP-CTERM sorting domain-containing protein [Opitutaceae bacterium]